MNIPLNIDWQQILLHFFNFSILVGGLYLLLFKPVKSFMAKREKHYADMESAAVAREKDTEELKAEMAKREAAFDTELEEKRAAAAKEAEAFAQQQRDAAKAQADRILSACALAASRCCWANASASLAAAARFSSSSVSKAASRFAISAFSSSVSFSRATAADSMSA